jgi:hypothetical protein
MLGIFDFKGLSDNAKFGKIALLIGVVLAFFSIGILTVILMIFFWEFTNAPQWFGLLLLGMSMLSIFGLVVKILALAKTQNNEFRNAGIFAIIGSLLLPVDIFTLAGGVLCLTSDEAKSEETKVPLDARAS